MSPREKGLPLLGGILNANTSTERRLPLPSETKIHPHGLLEAQDTEGELKTLASLERAVTDCTQCPRLRKWCRDVAQTRKREFRDQEYWGRPVPSFGDPDARLLIVGLAPAAHGANRTGRV